MKRIVQPFGNQTVRLRLLAESDLDMTMAWRNRDDVRVWFKQSQPIAPARHRAWFAEYLARDDDFVFVVEAGGLPVGQVSVYRIQCPEGQAEVGRFVAAPGSSGRGYMTLACAELLRFCAEILKLTSVYLEVKENNERAIRMYVRHGFREEDRAEGLIRMSRSLHREQAGSLYAAEA